MPVLSEPALVRARRAVTSVGVVRDAALELMRLTYVSPRPVMMFRDELAVLLNRRRLLGVGVEIGVKEGEFSEMLLRLWKGRSLISIDPWQAAPQEEYVDIANVEQAQHDAFMATAQARLAGFGERSTIWRLTSTEAAPKVLGHSLDFAYIDARHDYESVLEDLADWFGKVRPGGVIAGHDYVDGDFPEGRFGVRSAVDEFFGRRGLPVHSTRADAPWYSWFVLVPARAASTSA